MEGFDSHFGAVLTLGASEVSRLTKLMEELGYEYFSAGEQYMQG